MKIDEAGFVSPLGRVRSESHALHVIVDYVAQQKNDRQQLHLAVLETNATEHVARLKVLALQELHPFEIFDAELTSVMGLHAGLGLVGLSYYYE